MIIIPLNVIPLNVIHDAQSGSQQAKMAIIEAMQPIIKKLSGHWDYQDKEDALNSGALALCTALTKYDIIKHSHIAFSTFAYSYIKEELQAEFARMRGLPRRIIREYQTAQYIKPTPTVLSNGFRIDDIKSFISVCSYNDAETIKKYVNE